MSGLISRYISDQSKGNWAKSTKQDFTRHLNRFQEVIQDITKKGNNTTVKELTRDHMRHYCSTMAKLPPVNSSSGLRGQSYKQQINMAEKQGLARLNPKTLETAFTCINSFLNWAAKEEDRYLTNLEGLKDACKLNKEQEAVLSRPKERQYYNSEEIKQLFSGDVYQTATGCDTTPSRLQPWQFWVPIIAIFTGARVEEICQLRLSDIKTGDDGTWYFHINDAEESQRLKTVNARRVVPIHDFLTQDLHFLTVVKGLQLRGEDDLFGMLKPSKQRGNRSDAVSKWFTRYRRTVGIGNQSGHSPLNFHSFRHTAIHNLIALKKANARQVQKVIGHGDGGLSNLGITEIYAGDYPPKMLKADVIDHLDCHSLDQADLSHLKKHPLVPKGDDGLKGRWLGAWKISAK